MMYRRFVLAVALGALLPTVPVLAAPLLVASVLPGSRSVAVGETATAFVTVLNAGDTTGTDCNIAVASAFDGTFGFRTTDAVTNAATGVLNDTVDIPAGGGQTFVIALAPAAVIGETNVEFEFGCTNAASATTLTGINTLLFSSEETAGPDVIALAATASTDGIVAIAAAEAPAGAFSVATANVGTGASLTVAADTGAASLPLNLAVCETDPLTGACINPLIPAANLVTTIDAGATPTFAVFVSTDGSPIDADPATNRVFLRFVDEALVTRGATSVAVQAEAAASSEGTPWILNTTLRSAHILESAGGQGVLVNVQTVDEVAVSGESFTVVTASGIPAYDVTLTEADVAVLNARPRAATDFASGSTTASAGEQIAFGGDIGFNSQSGNCTETGGDGYWPPGPVCPTAVDHVGYFPIDPTDSADDCETGLGALGYWVNGTSIYNWGDGQSYEGRGVWQTLAPLAEQYDVDICGGHAANGDYHHHFYSACLAALVGDEGTGHSPVYGFAADGYAIYGPWVASGALARSSWVTRDYSAGSASGCGSAGVRNCQYVNPLDPALGTESVTAGPATTATVTTLSGNTLVASAGYYFEDHYHDAALAAQGGAWLDAYNGHTDATRGYHYHVTVTEEGGTLQPAFPYTVSTRFRGELRDNAVTSCGGGMGGGPPGGGPR